MSCRLMFSAWVVLILSVCLCAQGVDFQITNESLPPGQQGNVYAAAFNATGGNAPYSWKISAGAAPSGIAMNKNGNFVGTPTSAGKFNFTVMVSDANSNTATASFNTSIAAATGYDGPAQLPIVAVPSSMADTPAPGAIISVNAGDDLQAALNGAQCGDTVQLQAGATFTGHFQIPALNCDSDHWIIIRTSSPDRVLPVEGQRLTPCYAGVASLPGRPQYSCGHPQNVLAKLVASDAIGPLTFQTGANHYRLMGLELTRPVGAKGAMTLMSVAHGGMASYIVLDRTWLHGTTQDETHDGFDLTGTNNVAIVNSYFSDFHCTSRTGSCMEAHAISGGGGNHQDGPYVIQNNFLESSAQAILFGGAAATMTPTDITIRFNHFFKPWQWMKGNSPFQGGDSGNPFIVRHHLELKNAVRVLIENNLMEDVWGGFGEPGDAILLTPRNQHTAAGNVCPLCRVTDVTVRYTHISHAGGGIVIVTGLSIPGPDGAPAASGTRFSIHDVVMDDISRKYLGWDGFFLVANMWPANPVNTITINHVTGLQDSTGGVLILGNLTSNPEMYGFVFTNNLVTAGRYPVWNAGRNTSCAYADMPLTSINNCFASYTFSNNALIAAPSHFPPTAWPAGNMFAATPVNVGFVQYHDGNGGNYQLVPTSPYKNMGSDGRDVGADIVGLNAVLTGVE